MENKDERIKFWVKFCKNVREIQDEYDKLSKEDRKIVYSQVQAVLKIEGFVGLKKLINNPPC